MVKEYLTVTIDTEADYMDRGWIKRKPLEFRSIIEGIPHKLDKVFKPFGVKPVYLLTKDVLLNDECIDLFCNIKAGCEFGAHQHFSDIKKVPFYYGGEKEFEELKELTEIFKERFGYYPVSYRAGRFGINKSTIFSLEKLGYLVDTSVTPHINWKHAGLSMDFRFAPEQPYMMDKEFIVRPGCSNILEVPLSIVSRFLRKALWLRPTFTTGNDMIKLIKNLRKRYRQRREIIYNMMFHVMEICKGASPFSSTEREVNTILDRMRMLFEFCSLEGIIFATLSEIRKILL